MTGNRVVSILRGTPQAIARSRFLMNMAVLMTGTAISQALLLVAAPFLSRLFDPTAFGIYGLYAATLGVLAPVLHMQYGRAVVLPKDDSDAGALFFLGGGIAVCWSAVSVVVIAIGGRLIARLLKAPDMDQWLWWVPVSLLFVGVCEVLEFWATRRKQFWSISSRRIVRSVTQLTVQLGTGVAKQGSAGLIAGTILGQVAETFMLGIQVIRQDIRVLSGSLQRNRMRAVAAEYRDFPVFGVPVSLLGAVSQNVPILMLSAFFGTSTVGLYAMAVRVLLLPADFLTASLRQVFFQRAAEAEAHGMDAFHLFRRASLILAGVVLLPVLVVFLVAPWLFGAVLGSQWREAGEYARWLVLWVAFLVVNVPASAMLQVKKRQKLLLYNAVGLIVARVLAVAVPGLLGNAVAAIAGYALVGVLANGILIFQADRILLAERSSAAVSAHGGPEF